MYRFLLRPKWLFGHVLLLAGVITFVNFGFWQLRRLEERRDYNALIEARFNAPARPYGTLAAEHGRDPDDLEYRVATIEGHYLASEEVLVLAQSFKGRSGMNVVTPLAADDGTHLLIDRGWVDLDTAGPPAAGAEPPVGVVRVTGILRKSEDASTPGPQDPATGSLERIGRVDLQRLQGQLPFPLEPVYLEVLEQEPPQTGGVPEPREPPELSDGPHLSYAVQWFIFAGIALVGYPILVQRQARPKRRRAA